MTRRQGIFWILTIPAHEFTPYLPSCCQYVTGQLEEGSNTGYKHWQILVAFKKKESIRGVKRVFGDTCHAELSRSDAARSYCQKEETAIRGTQFEFGSRPIQRNNKIDWESIWAAAKSGVLEDIPAGIRTSNYRTLRCIGADYSKPVGMERQCFVFWGVTGSGKSRRAWEEAGMEAYCKDPRTKFW